MIEISFSRLSQILLDLDFSATALEGCGNENMANRLRCDFAYLQNICEVSKNEFKGFTE